MYYKFDMTFASIEWFTFGYNPHTIHTERISKVFMILYNLCPFQLRMYHVFRTFVFKESIHSCLFYLCHYNLYIVRMTVDGNVSWVHMCMCGHTEEPL